MQSDASLNHIRLEEHALPNDDPALFLHLHRDPLGYPRASTSQSPAQAFGVCATAVGSDQVPRLALVQEGRFGTSQSPALADGASKTVERRDSVGPVNAGIGDGLPVFKGLSRALERLGLVALLDVGLDHDGKHVRAACGDLCRHVVGNERLGGCQVSRQMSCVGACVCVWVGVFVLHLYMVNCTSIYTHRHRHRHICKYTCIHTHTHAHTHRLHLVPRYSRLDGPQTGTSLDGSGEQEFPGSDKVCLHLVPR